MAAWVTQPSYQEPSSTSTKEVGTGWVQRATSLRSAVTGASEFQAEPSDWYHPAKEKPARTGSAGMSAIAP